MSSVLSSGEEVFHDCQCKKISAALTSLEGGRRDAKNTLNVGLRERERDELKFDASSLSTAQMREEKNVERRRREGGEGHANGSHELPPLGR